MEAGELHPDDEIVITGTDTGAIIMKAGELRLDYDPVPVVTKGQSFSLRVPAKSAPPTACISGRTPPPPTPSPDTNIRPLASF